MARKVALFVCLLVSLCFGNSLAQHWPPSFEGNRMDIHNSTQMAALVHILKAYPKTVEIINHQKVIIQRLQENQALYEGIRKDLERKQRRDKILVITLGVSIPVVAGLVGYGVWKLARR